MCILMTSTCRYQLVILLFISVTQGSLESSSTKYDLGLQERASSLTQNKALPIYSRILSNHDKLFRIRRQVEGLETFYEHLIKLGLSKICLLLRDAGLENLLTSTGSFTLFAPTDEAFALLPGGTLEQIQDNTDKLREFLLYHIVQGRVLTPDIQNDVTLPSLQGAPIRFNVYTTSTGKTISVAGGEIVAADQIYKDDVIHVVDRVLYPVPTIDILGQAKWTLDRLYRLIVSAGLIDRLTGGTFTLFAPNDEAISSLSQAAQQSLLGNITLLQDILLNHVVVGTIYTTGLYNGLMLRTLGGAPLEFKFRRGLILVNGVPIVEPDVSVTNGVIHVLNRLLVSKNILEDCQCVTDSKTSQEVQIQEHGFTKPVLPSRPAYQDIGSEGQSRIFGQSGVVIETQNQQRVDEFGTVEESIGSYPNEQTFSTGRIPRPTFKQPFKTDIPYGHRKTTGPTKPYKHQQFTHHPPQRYPSPRPQVPGHRPHWRRPPQPQAEPTSQPKKPYVPPRQPPRPAPEPTAPRFQQTPKTPAYQPRPTRPAIHRETTVIFEQGLEQVSFPDIPVIPIESEKPVVPIGPERPVVPAELERPLIPAEPQTPIISLEPERPVIYEESSRPIIPIDAQRPVFLETTRESVPQTEFDTQRKTDEFIQTGEPGYIVISGKAEDTKEITQPREPIRPTRPGLGKPVSDEKPTRFDRPEIFVIPVKPESPEIIEQKPVPPSLDSTIISRGPPEEVVDVHQPETIPDVITVLDILQKPDLVFRQPISFSIIYELFQRVGLLDTLNQPEPLTLFIPSDDAFQTLPRGTLQELRDNPDLLHQILLYHLITVPPPQGLTGTTRIPTAQGLPALIKYDQRGQITQIDGANVIASTEIRDGHVIYVISRLLYPLPKSSINAYLSDRHDIYKYFSYLVKSHLDDVIKGPELFTLFLPINEAFDEIPRDEIDRFLNNRTLMEAFLLNHVVSGIYYVSDFESGLVLPSLRDGELHFRVTPEGEIKVNQADIVEPDIVTGNGIIHVVDSLVYRPPYIVKDPVSPIIQTERHHQHIPFDGSGRPKLHPTIRSEVPTPAFIDQRHIQPTLTVRRPIPPVTGRPVHIPQPPQHPKRQQPKPEVDLSLIEILRQPNSVFANQPFSVSVMYDLFQQTGLTDILSKSGPFTVFLPIDASISGQDFENVRTNPELLRQVLLYHVIAASLPPTDSRTTYMVTTAGGQPVILTYDDGGNVILVDGVEVLTSTVGNNGIIYIITKPLYPLPKPSIVDYLQNREDLTRVLSYIIQARIDSTFRGPDPFTFFVPSNDAFNKLPDSELRKLINNGSALEEFLLNHVVSGIHYTKELKPGLILPTPRGAILKFQANSDGGITVNGATIQEGDITTGTGIIHIIDEVIRTSQEVTSGDRHPVESVIIVPPRSDFISSNVAELARGMGLNRFVSWLISTDLIKVVQDGSRYTIFAPTDEAINSLPGLENIEKDPNQLRTILKYHIAPIYIRSGQVSNEQTVKTLLDGKGIRFNIYQDGQLYTASGAPFAPSSNPGNVLIAVVDRVLFPPQGDIYTTVTKLSILSELRRALERTGLDNELKGQGPFTLFAPSDKAFENLSPEERNRLLNNPQAFLTALRRHLVRGQTIYTSGVVEGMVLKSETGEDLTLSLKPTCIAVDGVNVIFPDISTTNGVLHVIDHFL